MRRLLVLLFCSLSLHAAAFKSHDGTTLYYDVVGKGEKVVLLSGGPGFSPEYLRPVAEKLGSRYAFVLFHQRGTGKSVVPVYDVVGDLEALREELKVKQLTIAGHSFGGILSMMYAREHPQRIAKLVLIDSGGPTLKSVMKFNANLEARFSEEDKAKVKEWTAAKTKENHRRAVLEITKAKTPAYFADRARARPLMDSMTEESFHDGVFWSIVPQMMALDLREGLEKVKAPVLVIHGKQDPLETAEEVHQTFPGSRLEMLDDAGHFPWLEQPDRFYKIINDFLSQGMVPALEKERGTLTYDKN
ncbi:MAG TPA: alpha/beta hydrolase [Thermoanaerobaculia bacterium]|jgi:proline iminopeptidase